MADHPMDTTVTDHLLATTRAVRKRLDLDRPVEPEVLLECLRLAVQAPTGSNSQNWHWLVDHRSRQAGAAQGALRLDGPPVPRVAGRERRRSRRPGGCTSRPSTCMNILDQRPGARDPVRRRTARRVPAAVRRLPASTARSSRPCGASCSPAAARGLGSVWTTLHLAHEAETARAARHPRRLDPGRADPDGVLRPATTSSPPSARRSRASPTGTRGARRPGSPPWR